MTCPGRSASVNPELEAWNNGAASGTRHVKNGQRHRPAVYVRVELTGVSSDSVHDHRQLRHLHPGYYASDTYDAATLQGAQHRQYDGNVTFTTTPTSTGMTINVSSAQDQ